MKKCTIQDCHACKHGFNIVETVRGKRVYKREECLYNTNDILIGKNINSPAWIHSYKYNIDCWMSARDFSLVNKDKENITFINTLQKLTLKENTTLNKNTHNQTPVPTLEAGDLKNREWIAVSTACYEITGNTRVLDENVIIPDFTRDSFNNVLFLDTESDPVTKKPDCLQWVFNDRFGIIEDFNDSSYTEIQKLWSKADAVIMYNSPYDLGVLSIMYGKNKYKWKVMKHGPLKGDKSATWDMILFGNRYNVRKIAFTRNIIKPLNRTFRELDFNTLPDLTKQRRKTIHKHSTPVIDLLKLWSILVDDKGISLKALIKKELHRKPIPYSPEAAKSEAYRLQDVFCLRELLEVFFNRVTDLEGLENYTWDDWGFIKTPATFTKNSYREAYPDLPKWKKCNDEIDKHYRLSRALENAFHGGITVSFFRGTLDNTGWIDIKGAYSKAIQVLNTDSFLKYEWRKLNVSALPGLFNLKSNILFKARVNFVMQTVDKSLKIFRLKTPVLMDVWSDDLKTCKNLYPDFKYTIIEAYEAIPLNEVKESLAAIWDKAKQEEGRLNGKTSRYRFHKFRSNTSYGIKAQRQPFQTVHTNMVIAGMITAKAHFVLTTIIRTLEDLGFENLYNDTDSSCFLQGKVFSKEDMNNVLDVVNKQIFPFEVDSEGINKTSYILSLKRYVSERGTGDSKIRLHGKGRYNITENDIYKYVVDEVVPDKPLMVTQLAANTKIGMGMIIKLFPYIKPYMHPFMFCKNIPVEPDKQTMAGFMREWYSHIDSKTSFQKGRAREAHFKREFHTFKNIHKALRYFRAFTVSKKKMDYNNLDYRSWDEEILQDFGFGG